MKDTSSIPVEKLLPGSVLVAIATPDMWEHPVKPAEESAILSSVDKRKREYRAGRHCASKVLSQLGVENFPLLNDQQRAPIWPTSIVGSLTHCDNFCCVVATNKPDIISLGIDAEPLAALPNETTALICHNSELLSLQTTGLTEGYWRKVIFSAKEAFYKAYFPLCRQYLDFLEAKVKIQPGKTSSQKFITHGEFVIQLLTPPHPALYNQQSFSGRYLITHSHILTAITLFKPS